MLLSQELILLSDPLALYHVVVKDQHIFEEPDLFVVSVFMTPSRLQNIDFRL
jgi:hypothetical protein